MLAKLGWVFVYRDWRDGRDWRRGAEGWRTCARFVLRKGSGSTVAAQRRMAGALRLPTLRTGAAQGLVVIAMALTTTAPKPCYIEYNNIVYRHNQYSWEMRDLVDR